MYPLDKEGRYKVTLIQAPVHGQVELVGSASHHWTYIPQDGYKGPDRAVFVVEAGGKRVKAVVNFLVLPVINEPKEDDEVKERVPECKSFDFRVLDKSSGTLAPQFEQNCFAEMESVFALAEIHRLVAGLANVMVSASNLPCTAVAETTGQGSFVEITLDTSAPRPQGRARFVCRGPNGPVSILNRRHKLDYVQLR